MRLSISSRARPNSVGRGIRCVEWALPVRNFTGPLADRKAGRSYALVDNLDDDHNHDIGDVDEAHGIRKLWIGRVLCPLLEAAILSRRPLESAISSKVVSLLVTLHQL